MSGEVSFRQVGTAKPGRLVHGAPPEISAVIAAAGGHTDPAPYPSLAPRAKRAVSTIPVKVGVARRSDIAAGLGSLLAIPF